MKKVFRIVCIFFVIFIISKELIISMISLAFLSKLIFSIFITIYIVLERASNTIALWNRRQMKSDRIYQDEEFISIIDSIDSELKADYSNTNHIWNRSMITRHHFFASYFFIPRRVSIIINSVWRLSFGVADWSKWSLSRLISRPKNNCVCQCRRNMSSKWWEQNTLPAWGRQAQSIDVFEEFCQSTDNA